MRLQVSGIRVREAALALMVLVVSGLLALAEPRFLNASNLVSVGTGMIYDLPVAAGMTLVLALGGIDLSVGAIIGLTSVITAMYLRAGGSVAFAVPIALAAAGGAGALNGVLVARFKVAPFLVTLGTMSIARGAATVLTSGYYLSGLPPAFVEIGRGQLLGVPYPVFVVLGVVVVFDVLLRRWKASTVSYQTVLSPPVAILLSVWLLGEPVSGNLALGG